MRYTVPIANLGLMCLLGVLFWQFPQIDISFSRLFIQSNGHFFSDHAPFFFFMRHLMQVILPICVLVLAILAVAARWSDRIRQFLPTRASLYLILCILIGPGLVVNWGMKEHWGRPRPAHTLIFGGDKVFQPAWVMSNQCTANCAFVCGDASVGFVGLALVPLVRRRRRRTVILSALLAGSLIGLSRIAVGGHFLSDVMFSGFLTYFACLVCSVCILRAPPGLREA